jgi:hypothetical protein
MSERVFVCVLLCSFFLRAAGDISTGGAVTACVLCATSYTPEDVLIEARSGFNVCTLSAAAACAEIV